MNTAPQTREEYVAIDRVGSERSVSRDSLPREGSVSIAMLREPARGGLEDLLRDGMTRGLVAPMAERGEGMHRAGSDVARVRGVAAGAGRDTADIPTVSRSGRMGPRWPCFRTVPPRLTTARRPARFESWCRPGLHGSEGFDCPTCPTATCPQ